MEIEQSSLYREIQNIISAGAKPVHYSWSAQIHANGQTYNALKVVSIDILRDYEGNYSDSIIAEMWVPMGTFWKKIYPYMDAVEVTLVKYPLLEVGDSANGTQPLESERYIALLHQQGSPYIENTGMNEASEDALNLTDLLFIKVELINQTLNQLRMVSASPGIIRNTTVEKALRAVMSKESQTAIVDQARQIKGVDMVPANNQTVRDHIVIPQGTPLVHIPQWIHEKCGGVYSAGFGYYLQQDWWYIYPLFDPTRSNQQSPALTIINVPKNKFPGVERTYRQDGDNIVLLSTGDVKFKDDSNSQQLNYGNGARWADANKVVDGFVTTKNNEAVASRGATNTEVVTAERANGYNNVPVSSNPINANPFVEYSKLARRNGSLLALSWENSNPALIRPGMLVMVLYLDGDTIATIYGVMLKAHHHVRMQGQGMTSTRHVTDSMLSVFVKRPLGTGDNTDLGVITPPT
jgi:hypothetical protein